MLKLSRTPTLFPLWMSEQVVFPSHSASIHTYIHIIFIQRSGKRTNQKCWMALEHASYHHRMLQGTMWTLARCKWNECIINWVEARIEQVPNRRNRNRKREISVMRLSSRSCSTALPIKLLFPETKQRFVCSKRTRHGTLCSPKIRHILNKLPCTWKLTRHRAHLGLNAQTSLGS